MNVRAPSETAAETDAAGAGADDGTASLAKRLLVVAGLFAIGYVAVRVLDSREVPPAQSIEDVQERPMTLAPAGVRKSLTELGDRADEVATIPIGVPGTEKRDPDAGETDEHGSVGGDDVVGGPDDATGDVLEETETRADYTDDERPAEEIAERAEPDAGEKPAEPGEMIVDEDVAEDLVDDADDESTDADEPDDGPDS